MPIYSYSQYDAENGQFVEGGRTITRFFSMRDDIPQTVTQDGDLYKRDLLADQGKVAHRPGNWPLYSEAAGVNPEQINEAREDSRRAGVPTEFTPDGRAVFTDPGHRRRYMKHAGLRDLAAFY